MGRRTPRPNPSKPIRNFRGAVLSALLLVAAGCSPQAARYEGDPKGPTIPARPPEHVLRRHPDFRFTDLPARKQFFLRFYSDEKGRTAYVSVLEEGGQERPATPEERGHALAAFRKDWTERGDSERDRFPRDVHENESARSATLVDLKIRDQEGAIGTLQERIDAVRYNLRAREATNVHPKKGDELSTKFHEPSTEFLRGELARLERAAQSARERLATLRRDRARRDAEYGRSTRLYFQRETFDVSLLLKESTSEELVARVKKDVQPGTWAHPEAAIHIEGGFLLVRQRPWVLRWIRSYLDNLRVGRRG